MKERPILFKGEMVRAILDGRKTQTRRVVKPQLIEPDQKTLGYQPGKFTRGKQLDGNMWCLQTEPYHRHLNYAGVQLVSDFFRCPYGQVGDRLWVRETFANPFKGENPSDCVYLADSDDYLGQHLGVHQWTKSMKVWTPSIHMPRWASRITLEITDVRVQRLQDISEEDCAREGIGHPATRECKRPAFQELWKSINGPDSWSANPWVWVLNFKVLK